MNPEDFEEEAMKLKHMAELDERDQQIARLERRIADLEDFLRGAAMQFCSMARR